jgi:hypothetical protein
MRQIRERLTAVKRAALNTRAHKAGVEFCANNRYEFIGVEVVDAKGFRVIFDAQGGGFHSERFEFCDTL